MSSCSASWPRSLRHPETCRLHQEARTAEGQSKAKSEGSLERAFTSSACTIVPVPLIRQLTTVYHRKTEALGILRRTINNLGDTYSGRPSIFSAVLKDANSARQLINVFFSPVRLTKQLKILALLV